MVSKTEREGGGGERWVGRKEKETHTVCARVFMQVTERERTLDTKCLNKPCSIQRNFSLCLLVHLCRPHISDTGACNLSITDISLSVDILVGKELLGYIKLHVLWMKDLCMDYLTLDHHQCMR